MILLLLFWTFFKIGLFTFGGGYAMLPLIRQEVTAFGWIAEKRLPDLIALGESTPGPIAINLATYIGAEQAGVAGAVCATLGVVLPSFLVILLVAKFYLKFRKSRAVEGLLCGLRPAVVGLIGSAAVSMTQTVLFPSGISAGTFTGGTFWFSLAVFAVTLIAAFRRIHPVLLLLGAAALGIGAGFLGILNGPPLSA